MMSTIIAATATCASVDAPAPTLVFWFSKPKAYSSGRSSSRSCDARVYSGVFLPMDFAITFENQPKTHCDRRCMTLQVQSQRHNPLTPFQDIWIRFMGGILQS